MSKFKYVFILFYALGLSAFAQGPFSPAADSIGSTAIHKDSNIIYGWVNSCVITRGLQNILNSSGPLASVGDETMVYGKANLGVVSLGDGGSATITLTNPIANHNGYDFALYENGFYDAVNGGYFLELAFVEVSSNGQDFYRFPNQSLTPTDVQTGSFGVTDPTQITGFAGKYRGLYGTPFDLSVMDTVVGLDINSISHIKIIDVIGTIDTAYASYDSYGRVVNDPYPTEFSSGGFDLDAIALIDSSLVTGIKNLRNTRIKLYPNPAQNMIYFSGVYTSFNMAVYDIQGNMVLQQPVMNNQLDISTIPSGLYFVSIQTKTGVVVRKFLKQ